MKIVVEIAANDGYLLQYVKEREIPCYGIEPTHSTAKLPEKKESRLSKNFLVYIKQSIGE